MPPTTTNLPGWASFRTDEAGGPRMHGASLVVDVDADAMYPAILDAYREAYPLDGGPSKIPPEWRTRDGELKAEWRAALEDLHSETPGAYWLECAHQAMKLDLQLATRSFALNIVVRSADKARWAQKGRDAGPKKAAHAAGGPKGGRDAREHFKRVFGFLPA